MESWSNIGIIVGNTSTQSFKFIVTELLAKVGDIVVTSTIVPTSTFGDRHEVHVWGRIVAIDRFNPFFPAEAATELNNSGVALENTPLSSMRDHLVGEVLILGQTDAKTQKQLDMSPLTYPVKPSAYVQSPDAESIKALLVGDQTGQRLLHLGELIGRKDVPVSLAANAIVARHMAILAMTGGGKTVASRRVIKELAKHQYPMVILDPHGDYLGLYEKQSELGVDVKLFFPTITVNEENISTVMSLTEKMGTALTNPQYEIHEHAFSNVVPSSDEPIISYLGGIINYIGELQKNGGGSFSKSSFNPVLRNLRQVKAKLEQMELNNDRLRKTMPDYEFEKMPDPSQDPELLVSRGQISIFYLAGFDHLAQSTIGSLVLEKLFDHRASLSNKIPPYFAVIEEAHNFIPSRSEGTGDTPSLPTIRRMITEGRKFGTGLLIISQRPSRLDETILAQCNTFLVLRLVNPKDKNFVRSVMENLSDSDANTLQSFGRGQGLISGQAVKFPLLVQVGFDPELITDQIGDENSFFDQVESNDNKKTAERKTSNEAKAKTLKNLKPKKR